MVIKYIIIVTDLDISLKIVEHEITKEVIKITSNRIEIMLTRMTVDILLAKEEDT